MKESEQLNPSADNHSGFAALELKANLNPEQRAYLEVLKEKMRKILGNKTKQELARAGDLTALKNYKAILVEILEFLQTKEIKSQGEGLEFTTPEGKKIKIEFQKELRYWADFYAQQNIDWIEMPERLELSSQDKEALLQGAAALCPEGDFEKLKLLIIPENLADTEIAYNKLWEKTSSDFRPGFFAKEFINEGGFTNLVNKSNKLRLILVRDVQDAAADMVYKKTLGKSAEKLEAASGLFNAMNLGGIDAATYFVWQREYYNRHREYLDEKNVNWLPESKIGRNAFSSDRRLLAKYNPQSDGLLLMYFPSNMNPSDIVCRLAKTVEIG